jgi:toxin ParE1/3/4
MLPVVWLDSATADLTEIITYIAGENPSAARRLKARLEAAPLPLAEHPYLYPKGRVPGTRELVAHPNYVLVYLVAATRIEIVSVLHARQEYP